MKLHEIAIAAGSCAQVVQVRQFRVSCGYLDKGRALLFGPFAIHEIVDRIARPPPCADCQPCGNCEAEQRVCHAQPDILVEHQRRDHSKIEQQVGLVMQVVGLDREAAGAVHDMALPGQQSEGEHDCDQGNRDAFIGGRSHLLPRQLNDRSRRDPERRKRDQHDLENRCQRFRLAMTETMVLVGGHGSDPYTGQRGEAGDQVERRIGEAAKHCGRAGPPACPTFEGDENHRDRDRGNGGRARQRALLAHGYNSVFDHASVSSSRLNSRRSWRRY